jgi:hypothetical protein
MIRRIRELAAALHDETAGDLRALEQEDFDYIEDEEDRALDVLVKNAVRSNWLEHDPKKVWKQLKERVRGPFGQLAVEEPALVGEPMPLTFEGREVVDRTPESMRYSFFRLSDNVVPQR